jgi:phage-related protein
MREIIFYRTSSGNCPIEEFLDQLTDKQAQKVTWVLRLLGDLNIIPADYFKKLPATEDIWEVRTQCEGLAIRLLGFCHKSNSIVLTNGFAKKSQKTPAREIILAQERKKEYLNRSK